jgi:hypothetical protein
MSETDARAAKSDGVRTFKSTSPIWIANRRSESHLLLTDVVAKALELDPLMAVETTTLVDVPTPLLTTVVPGPGVTVDPGLAVVVVPSGAASSAVAQY